MEHFPDLRALAAARDAVIAYNAAYEKCIAASGDTSEHYLPQATDLYKQYASKLADAADKPGVKKTDCWDLKKEFEEKLKPLNAEDEERDRAGAPEKKLTREQSNKMKGDAREAINAYNAAYEKCIATASPKIAKSRKLEV